MFGSCLRTWGFILAALILAACTVDPFRLTGRQCPCIDGWVCNAAGACVLALDAGMRDAGGADDAPVNRPDSGGAIDAPVADAPAPDGGDVDAGPDVTSCDDLLSEAFFCDGFEDPTFAAWDGFEEMTGTVGTTSTPVYRGELAFRGETSAPNGRAAMLQRFAPITSGELWLRGYYYIPSSFPLNSLSLFYVFEDAGLYDGVATTVGSGGAVYVYYPPGVTMGGGTAPLDTWFCLQVRIVVANTGGSVSTWIDGTPTASVVDTDTLPANPYTAAIVGLERAHAGQPTALVYADEVALGTSMLPCD